MDKFLTATSQIFKNKAPLNFLDSYLQNNFIQDLFFKNFSLSQLCLGFIAIPLSFLLSTLIRYSHLTSSNRKYNKDRLKQLIKRFLAANLCISIFWNLFLLLATNTYSEQSFSFFIRLASMAVFRHLIASKISHSVSINSSVLLAAASFIYFPLFTIYTFGQNYIISSIIFYVSIYLLYSFGFLFELYDSYFIPENPRKISNSDHSNNEIIYDIKYNSYQ